MNQEPQGIFKILLQPKRLVVLALLIVALPFGLVVAQNNRWRNNDNYEQHQYDTPQPSPTAYRANPSPTNSEMIYEHSTIGCVDISTSAKVQILPQVFPHRISNPQFIEFS